jgi:Protein of unknown function (DUF4238)
MTITDPYAKKPKQHYVWQKYLEAWTEGGALYCLLNGRIFSTGTARVGFENHFYGLKDITDEDLKLLNLLLTRENPHPASKSHEELVLRNVLGPTLQARQNPQILKSPQISQLLESYNANAIDNQHTVIESRAVPMLAKLLDEDISWFDDQKQAISFCAFLAAQSMRTRKVKQRTIDRIKANMNVDFSRIWDILGLIFAFRLGATLFFERTTRPPVLVRNETGVDFLTADQPVVNLDADGENPPDTLTFYYPLSPGLALWIGDPESPDALTAHGISAETVIELNNRVVKGSLSQIYGRTRESLEAVLELAAR